MVAIVDYDAGNIKSVEKALQYIGEHPVITRDVKEIKKADHVIVPGVGAFEDAMEKMNRYELAKVLQDVAASGTPIMGICLGLQLFFERSDESEHDVKGLSLLPGEIVRFPGKKKGYKIPHMGWISFENQSEFKTVKRNSGGCVCVFCSFVLFKSQTYRRCSRYNGLYCSGTCGSGT